MVNIYTQFEHLRNLRKFRQLANFILIDRFPLVNQPALVLAVFYAVGVFLGNLFVVPIFTLFSALFIFGFMGLGVHGLAIRLSTAVGKQNYHASSLDCVGGLCEIARVVFLVVIVILMGWFNYTRHTSIISPYDLRRTVPEKGAIAVVRGQIAAPPKTQRFGTRERVQLSVDVSSIRLGEVWEVGYGRVVVITTNKLGLEYTVGKQIQVDGVLIPPESASSPGLYDYRQQLVRLGIYHELRTDALSNWVVSPVSPALSWSERFQKWGRSVLGRGFPDNDTAIELLWAMSLGWRTGLIGKTAEPFMRSGTMHLFAISGLHVALVAGILVALLRIIRMNRQWTGMVAIPLLWFYAGATGWQPSAVRATTMITLVLSAWVFKRPVNVLNSLGMAAFLILMWNPQQLFRASFQLSFAVVFSLAVVVPPVAEWLHAQVRPDAYLPQQLWPRWRQWILWPSYWLAGALAVSFGAWLASLPLVAHHFNLFSPIALLANVPVVICGMAALASCLGSLLFGAWLEPVSVLFNHAAWFYMNAMMAISRWAADLPGAWQYVRSPSHWMIIGWYLLLFAIGSGWLMKAKMRRWLFGGMVVYICALIWSWEVDRDSVRMNFLPDGPVIHMEGEEGMLIDCGDERMVEYVIPRHLRSRGVDNIGDLVLTHSVKHHAGGFVGLLEEQLITQISLSHARSTSKVHKMVLENLGDSNRKRIVSDGDKIGPWEVLHPASGEDFSRSTDDALVLAGEFHGVRVLLMSDLGRDGRQALIKRDADLRADVLVVSVPDRSSTLGLGMLRLIQPKVILVHDCNFPVTERASIDWLEQLQASGAQVFSVRKVGGIRLTVKSGEWRLENSRGILFLR